MAKLGCGELHLVARLTLTAFLGALPPVDLPIFRGQLAATVRSVFITGEYYEQFA